MCEPISTPLRRRRRNCGSSNHDNPSAGSLSDVQATARPIDVKRSRLDQTALDAQLLRGRREARRPQDENPVVRPVGDEDRAPQQLADRQPSRLIQLSVVRPSRTAVAADEPATRVDDAETMHVVVTVRQSVQAITELDNSVRKGEVRAEHDVADEQSVCRVLLQLGAAGD